MNRVRSRRGFTLMELVVVVLIIGVLTAFGVPQYFRTVETTKLDEASGLVAMAGTTHRMYALDHAGVYVTGTITTACNSGACPAGPTDACDLVRCRYLAQQDFDNKAYVLVLDNNTSATSCGGKAYNASASGAAIVACVYRRSGSSPGTDISPYNGWGYAATSKGEITIITGTPAAVSQ